MILYIALSLQINDQRRATKLESKKGHRKNNYKSIIFNSEPWLVIDNDKHNDISSKYVSKLESNDVDTRIAYRSISIISQFSLVATFLKTEKIQMNKLVRRLLSKH